MEKKLKLEKNYSYFIFFTIIFIIFSTPFYNLYETKLLGGSDGLDYFEISKSAPYIADNIQFIKSERFFFPYLVGIFSKFFRLEIFYTYQLTSLVLCFVFLYLNFKILKKVCNDYIYIFISLLILILNPYIIRYFISIPTLITDLIFMISTLLVILGFLDKNKKILYIGLIVGILSRQTVIALLIAFYLTFFINLYFSKEKFINKFDLIIPILIYVPLQYAIYNYASKSGSIISAQDLYYDTIFGILLFFKYSLKSLIIFIFLPILTFWPLLIFFYTNKLKILNKNLEIIFFLSISIMLIIGQPFMGGPHITGKNFIRLSNLAYPLILVFIALISTIEKKKINTLYKLFILMMFIWSMHPTFSKIKIFDSLKFLL